MALRVSKYFTNGIPEKSLGTVFTKCIGLLPHRSISLNIHAALPWNLRDVCSWTVRSLSYQEQYAWNCFFFIHSVLDFMWDGIEWCQVWLVSSSTWIMLQDRENLFLWILFNHKLACHGVSFPGNTRTRNPDEKFLLCTICRFLKISYFTNS